MKILYKTMAVFLLSLPLLCQPQEVTTLANVTANGGISVDDDGNLYVAHFGPLPPNPNIGKNIYKITPNGDVTLFLEGQLNVGSGNTIDGNGFLYQSNFATGAIYKIDLEGTIISANYATVSGPVGIAAGSDNTLYVCSCNTNSIKKISPSGALSNFVSGNFFNCANSITVGDNDNLYTTNFSDGRITKITPQGNMTTLGNTGVGNGHIIYRATNQSFYIASYSGNRIFKMDLSGNVELFAGTGSASTTNAANPLQATFNKPNGINISPDGCSLYISQDNDVIREIIFEDSDCATAVVDLDNVAELKLYPNPSTGKINFENNSDIQIISIVVFDMQGKAISKVSPSNNHEFNSASFAPGVYSFLLKDNTGTVYSKRIVIQ